MSPNTASSSRGRKRVVLAVGAGIAVAAAAAASAAGLGGLFVEQLGAESSVVAAPFDDGVTITWGNPEYDETSSEYLVTEFTLTRDSGDDIPAGELLVTIADADGTALTEASATTAGDAASEVFTLADGISVRDTERVSLVFQSTDEPV